MEYGLCGIDMDMDMDMNMDSCRPIPKELHIINSLTLLESMRWLIHASFFFFSFHIRVSSSSSLRSFLIPSTYRLILVPVIVITGANLGLKQRLISSSSDVPRTLIDATHSPPFLAPFGTVNPLPSVSIYLSQP